MLCGIAQRIANRCFYRAGLLVAVATLLALQHAGADAQGVPEIAGDGIKSKLALVIGNGGYAGGPLANPPNDAADIAGSLRAIGFDATPKIDLDLNGMRLEIAKFVSKLTSNSAAVVYFAGHGVQYAGTNYLLPIDALPRIKSPTDLETYAISLPVLMSQVTGRKNAISIFILDACRDSPFSSVPEITSGLARAVPRGLKRAPSTPPVKGTPLDGVIVAFSTSPNTVALDGAGRNSPYSKHLKQALRRPNTTLQDMLTLTHNGVTIETGGRQTPWYQSSLSGSYWPAGRGWIELEELLKLLIPTPDGRESIDAHNAYPWELGSTELSPIQWAHDGARDATDKTKVLDFSFRAMGPLVREGKVVITVNGAPTHHVLRRRQVPGQWRIALTGARSGVDAVAIENDALTHEFGGFGGASLLKEDEACRTGERTSGTTVYSIGFAGRIPAWLAEEWSCGSGGCNNRYILFYNKRDRSRFGCKG